MRTPDMLLKHLPAVGLPLGPLTDELTYHATPTGKLHSTPRCRAITRATKARIAPRAVTATQARYSALCQSCRSQLPEPVASHVGWCQDVEKALAALADVGVTSPLSHRYDTRAETGTTKATTWRHLAALDLAAVALTGVGLTRRQPPSPALAAIVDDLVPLVARTRDLVADSMPSENWVGTGRHVVALSNYAPQYQPGVTVHEELLARCDVVAALPYRYAFAFAAPNVAVRLSCSYQLGPAEPADTREVLNTALRLLLDRNPGDVVAFPDTDYDDALSAARLIHAPAA